MATIPHQGHRHNQVAEYWKEFSPLHNINEKTPPTIVFLGTNDYYLPVSAAKKYTGIMTEKGRRCDLKPYDGKQHGFCNFEHKDDYTKVLIEVVLFLVSPGYLKSAPTLQNK
ncbi:MAG: prolyl oligopeptidase family serine peptidase [Planctomycetota bacterium]